MRGSWPTTERWSCCGRSFRLGAGGRAVRGTATNAVNGSAAAELYERLLSRKGEIERAIATRVYAVSDPTEVGDPIYAEGLRSAVSAAIDYGLEGIQSSERNPPQVPPALLVQARIAARSGVGLDTVLRRYFAGYALLGDFLIEEAQEAVQGQALKRLLRTQAALFDRLIAAVSEEHRRDGPNGLHTSERRRLEWVQRLLAGEMLDTAELAYDLDATHLGFVARGSGAVEAIRKLAAALDRNLLMVRPDEQTVWAWLGGLPGIDLDEVSRHLCSALSPISLAMGEAADGPAGWRLSHGQAVAALPVATRGPEPIVRYADVALLASILQDDLLATSLKEIYLSPLERERDGGKLARETLRAYFAAERNVSSAAAALGVSRQAVAKRLVVIEERLNRSLRDSGMELEATLRMLDLTDHSA